MMAREGAGTYGPFSLLLSRRITGIARWPPARATYPPHPRPGTWVAMR